MKSSDDHIPWGGFEIGARGGKKKHGSTTECLLTIYRRWREKADALVIQYKFNNGTDINRPQSATHSATVGVSIDKTSLEQ